MKIAVITDIFPSSAQPWRGHSVYQTVRRLAGLGEVEVFAPFMRYPPFLRARTHHPVRIDFEYQPDGVKTRYFEYWVLPVVTRSSNGRSIAKTVRGAVEGFGPDVILSYFVYPEGYGALRVGESLKVPVVVKAIGTDLNTVGGRAIQKLTAQVLSRAERILTVSHALRERAIELGAAPERTLAILNGCDGEVFRPQDRGQARRRVEYQWNPRLILYVGRLDARKGLRELVEASVALRRTRQDFTTVLMGDGQDQERLRAMVREQGAEGYIKFLAAGSSGEVAEWMAAADLVTLPSYAEGCPNVVIEALACGRPMVASRVGGIPELMDESCGRMVAPRDGAALCAGLDETLNAAWDAEAISATHGRTWEEVADETFAVLEEAVKRS
ncbi:MAG: glycosyltransferase [Acidobacteriaceae bacterium]